MKLLIAAAALPLIFAPLKASAQAVPFWPGGYGYTLDEIWSYTPADDNYRYQGLGAANNRVYADRVSNDGTSVRFDVIDGWSGQWITDQTYRDGYKSSLLCARNTGFSAAGGVFDGMQFRPEGSGSAFGWVTNFNENAAQTTTFQLQSFLRPSLDGMGCEGDAVYPAYCNQNFNQQTGALAGGLQGECFLDKYDAVSGRNEWTAKWRTGDFATVGTVYVASGAIYVAGVANNIDGTAVGDGKTMHPYLVKLGKGGDVHFTRLYTQYRVDSQVGGKNILGFNSNGGLFMVAGGSVVTINQANGDVVKSFTLSGARTGSVVAVPQSSDFLLLPYSTPAQPRVFDVDGNVIEFRFSNTGYTDNILSMMINPANTNQVLVTTPRTIALLELRKSALADANAGFNPSTGSRTSTSAVRSSTRTTVATTTAAPTTTVAPAATTSVAPKSTTVASGGSRMAAGVVSALLGLVVAALAL